MTTKNEFKNYLVSIKDSKTDEVILETKINAYYRFRGDFMLHELYQKYSNAYQKEAYEYTIELKETRKMELDLQRLIYHFGSKVSDAELHLHAGKDGIYICYPLRISSWEEAKQIIGKWFVATYFQVKTRVDPNYLEMFGNFLLNAEGIEIKNSISLMDEYVEWICQDFNIYSTVEEVVLSMEVDLKEILTTSVYSLGFSNVIETTFRWCEIETVDDLRNISAKELMKYRSFGKRALNKVETYLNQYGLDLN